jgi:Ni,Fe-hydrogenase maturation factor
VKRVSRVSRRDLVVFVDFVLVDWGVGTVKFHETLRIPASSHDTRQI